MSNEAHACPNQIKWNLLQTCGWAAVVSQCLAALPAESRRLCCWGEALGCFSRAESSPLTHTGCTVCQVSERNVETWFLFGCSPLHQAVTLCWVKAVFAPTCAAGVQHGHVRSLGSVYTWALGFMIAHEQLCFTTKLLLNALFYCRDRLNLRLPGSVFRSLCL